MEVVSTSIKVYLIHLKLLQYILYMLLLVCTSTLVLTINLMYYQH